MPDQEVGRVTFLKTAAHVKSRAATSPRSSARGGYGCYSPQCGELTRRVIERGVAPATSLISRACSWSATRRTISRVAHYAGSVSIAVASGNFTTEQLREVGADHALASSGKGMPVSAVRRLRHKSRLPEATPDARVRPPGKFAEEPSRHRTGTRPRRTASASPMPGLIGTVMSISSVQRQSRAGPTSLDGEIDRNARGRVW
jgi:hypothetical protein